MRNHVSKLWVVITATLIGTATIQSSSAQQQQPTIKIGALFDVWDAYEESAFRHAVERENGGHAADFRVGAELVKLESGDSFHASKTVCLLLQDNVVGVFGPQSTSTLSHVHSICEILGIPHIETKWDFRLAKGQFLLNLYPHPETMKMAYRDIISRWKWSKIIILYENHASLERLEGIFQLTGHGIIASDVVIQQLPNRDPIAPDENIYWPMMKRLKDIYPDYTNLILDCDTDKIPQIMKAANQSHMMRDPYKYFFTTLDVQTLLVEDVLHGDVNITAFRIVDPEDQNVLNLVDSWNLWRNIGRSSASSSFDSNVPAWIRKNPPISLIPSEMPELRNGTFRLETALIYDAVSLFMQALNQFVRSQNHFQAQYHNGDQQRLEFKPVDCESPVPSLYGSALVSLMKQMRSQGLSGVIQLDEDGFRREVSLDVIEIRKEAILKIGEWNPMTYFTSTRTQDDIRKIQAEDLKKAHFVVGSVKGPPYFMMNDNGTYAGFVVDLMDKLKENLGFSYEFKVVSDHGSKQADEKWSGCIGEVLNETADICIGDLSITYDRGNAIDFTTPFMNLGISILYTKPYKKPPFIFSFLQPFHSDVWIYVATAYLAVSLILFLIARISPDEWTSPHICVQDPSELELTLHLTNSLWFTIGSLMQQGSDIAPRAASTRIVAGIWWFFTLIIVSSYTANLAAFLTSEGLEEGIKDIVDLPKQTKVKYGTLRKGSTRRFFEDSTFPLYMEINKNMEAMKPLPFVDKSSDGVDNVEKSEGRYAFFMESVSIEYATQRKCKLTQLGGLLDQKGYGIGLKKGSKFRDAFTTQVLNLSENGVIQQLKKKWWETEGGGKCATEAAPSTGAQALTLSHVGGVFVVLLGGCILAILMAFVEFFWKSRKLALRGGKSVWAEIWSDLKFALLCQGKTKPIKKRESLNPTLNSEAESGRYLTNNTRTSSMEQ